ncbi:DegT/DnrJ/EryC1/StrS family aminotransferase [Sulfurospirillum arcachonense]|uniref:DegT/DnrJ/EryC1/StrS family aminotransferase n=1 Tax=Sulfurospirillum arcachonense TaxID=57666 RepID=UPI000469E520|nr:DegT/DnrJ/EryC1/StrS family aminotransferase [Sulfurospirillum arcachonense]
MKLAINGGEKLRENPFPAYNTIDKQEEKAVLKVLRSGKLSTYLGTWHEDFYGGSEVQALEYEWANFFNVKHAISVNSATSGLYAAIGAIGIKAGDEVIVSPYTMSASATAILLYGGIPVFADVEDKYFCIDPQSVEKLITPKTKAIMAVDIFGQTADFKALKKIAQKHNLKIIEDSAQAPAAKLGDKFTGTLGDIGVFSLNYHKHIHSGEGGIIVTNDDDLAFKMQLIRNHGETVLAAKGYEDKKELHNMLGFNFRMTEIEAAIARVQLSKLDELIEQRIDNVKYLEEKLQNIPCLEIPPLRDEAKHVYYIHPLLFKEKSIACHRNKFIDAVKAELPPTLMRDDSPVLLSYGYVKPLYLQPLYQEKICFGEYPFSLSERVYKEGDCPVCEKLHNDILITHELMRPGMSKEDLDDVIKAFEKVWKNKEELL